MLQLLVIAVLTADPSTIRLSPGTHEVVKLAGLSRIAIADPVVADVTTTGRNEVLVTGKSRGRTTLTLWNGGGPIVKQIVVDDGKTSEIGRTVRELVSPTLRVEQFNGNTVIDGTLDSVEELRRLQTLVGDEPNVKLLVHLNPRVLPFVAEQMNAAFKKEGLLTAQAHCVGQTIFLEGSVADDRELNKALTIAQAIYAPATSSLRVH